MAETIATLFIAVPSFLLSNEGLLVATSLGRCIYQKLSMTSLVQGQEEEGSGVNGLAHSEQSMILQNYGFATSKVLCYPLAFLAVYHNASELRVDGMVFVESKTILGYHVKLPAKHREGFAIDAVCVTSCVHVGPCFVDCRVNSECGRVDWLISFYNKTLLIHKNQIRDLYLREVHGERIQPEMIGQNRVSV